MDVHVHFFERYRKKESRDGVAIPRNEVAVGTSQRSDEQSVLHGTRVDEQELLVGHAPVEGRQADDAGQTNSVPLTVDADAVAVEFRAEQFRDTLRRRRRLEREDPAAVMLKNEGDITAGHRQALYGVEAGRVFGARAPQELAPRRNLVEQPLDPDARSRGKGGRSLPDGFAMIDFHPPAVGTAHAAIQGQAGDTGD